MISDRLEERLPPLPLVPIPRAVSRRLRYGIDPALVIAQALAARSGSPVLQVLRRPWHSRRRAGGDHRRPVTGFRVSPFTAPEVIVVDDVVTTGSTLLAAVAALGPERVAMAVAANSALGVSTLSTS
jgi:predicted amidophosphoribosyltransferase